MGDGRAEREEERGSRLSGRVEAFASGFVALLALVLSAYTAFIQRQQLKAAVWPHVSLSVHQGSENDRPTTSITIKNSGVGPASIRAMRVSMGGKDVASWGEWIKLDAAAQNLPKSNFKMKIGSVLGEVLTPGQEREIFGSSSVDVVALVLGDEQTRFSLCYCSVQDDCWVAENTLLSDTADRTTPVASCPVYPVPFVGAPRGEFHNAAKGIRERAEKERAELASAVAVDGGIDAAADSGGGVRAH